MDDTGFTFPPKAYDFLKYVALVVLPAAATLILGIGLAIHWTAAAPTATIITLIDTFLGNLIGKSSSNFKAQNNDVFGELVVKQDPDGVPTGMRIVGYKENPILEEGKQVSLHVRREQELQ
jgi:hypothetical protein